jgi:hypothetical protein
MQTEQELELAKILVEALDLEDIEPGEINPEAMLFGFDTPDSLGLDSIDALEIPPCFFNWPSRGLGAGKPLSLHHNAS